MSRQKDGGYYSVHVIHPDPDSSKFHIIKYGFIVAEDGKRKWSESA